MSSTTSAGSSMPPPPGNRCRPNPAGALPSAGCLLYEVGVNDEQPGTDHVAGLRTSTQAHQRTHQLESARRHPGGTTARLRRDGRLPLEAMGSPLRD